MKTLVKKAIIGIFNKITKQVEMVLLGNDRGIYKYNGEKIVADNYLINPEYVARIYRMNFKNQ